MKILTIDNLQALAGYFAGLGDVRIKGTETWIDPELRGTPTVYCDCGNSAAGRPMFVFFRVGDIAPENTAEAAAAIKEMRGSHGRAARRTAANLAAERDNQR